MLVLFSCATGACVERRLLIRSDVSDRPVEIYVDGEPVGAAPQTIYFESYGPRDWRARAEGMESASGRVELEVPWYQYPVFDFFAEVLIPWTIVDEHLLEVKLRPLEERDAEALEKRANAFKAEAIKAANAPKDIGDKRTLLPPEERTKRQPAEEPSDD
ncbi:MAG: hypothetical protein KDB07_01975 [Planctomycetes bacterium]|nr:hypothetical protein [Planctomycetota bacterium]